MVGWFYVRTVVYTAIRNHTAVRSNRMRRVVEVGCRCFSNTVQENAELV